MYLNSSDTAPGQVWASQTTFATNCLLNAKDTGNLIGTAFVARDMMQIVNALNEDGLLRYWGFSYGTALGMTVAAMFPNRIDKIVLDGVLNPYEYYAGTDVEEITDTDAVFSGFFSGCLANPSNCALSKDGATADELSQKVYSLLYELKYHPMVVGLDITIGYIDYGVLKQSIKQALYSPSLWEPLSVVLHELLLGNATAALMASADLYQGHTIFPNNGPDAIYGIRCSDSALRSKNISSLERLLDAFSARSRLYGDILSVQAVTCAQWPFVAKERYSGGWEVKTKNPVLFIGNTYDPFTPLVSAHNASSGFRDSVVLQHDGYGVSYRSWCWSFWEVLSDYFVAHESCAAFAVHG